MNMLQGTMTFAEMKVRATTRDAKTDPMPQPKPTSLPLVSKNSPEQPGILGGALGTREDNKQQKLCDKCDRDIMSTSLPSPSPSPRLAPPSPDMPWLSKIPRPVSPLRNPDVHKLKSATSTGNLYTPQRSQSPKMVPRSKSNMSPSLLRKPWGYNGPSLPSTRDAIQ